MKGRVATGSGQGRHFTQLDWARRQFVQKLGLDPFPGPSKWIGAGGESLMNGAQSAARGNSPRDEVERVTLVDADDQTLGSCGKIEAHREGRLHRAFSILITSPDGKLLLQRRASGKYHFANRWSNACCGHPRPGEITYDEARRRLMEELGFTVPLIQVAELSYRAEDAVSGLVEHEYLHVFHGTYSGDPEPDPDEVSAWQWMGKKRIRANLASNPEQFTPWFAILVDGHVVD